MEILSFISAFVGFFVTLFLMPWAVKYLRRIGLVVKDMQKDTKPLIPVSGGIVVLVGIVAGLMSYIFFRVFFSSFSGIFILSGFDLVYLFAAISSILIITF